MVNKSDVVVGFVPEETKLENWLDEQLKKQENIATLNRHKFLVIVYADMPIDFYDNPRELSYTTNNFVTKVVDKYNTQGNWKIRYEYNKENNFIILVIR